MKVFVGIGLVALLYFLTKPSIKAGCVSVQNPFTGKIMSTCPGGPAPAAKGNVAGASLPIRQGPTNTDTMGLGGNANDANVNAPYSISNVDDQTFGANDPTYVSGSLGGTTNVGG